MCLIISRIHHILKRPRKARKDIKCYKVLLYHTQCKIYTTPCRRGSFIIEKINENITTLIPDYFQLHTKKFNDGEHGVEHGIHAFLEEKEAIEFAEYTKQWICNNYVLHIYECKIPKGYKY